MADNSQPGADYTEGTGMNEDAGKEFSVETPVGKIQTKGYHLGNVLQIVAAVLLGLMVMMMYEMRADTKSAAAAMQSSTRDAAMALAATAKVEHEKLGGMLEKSVEAQNEMNYILTLSQDDRVKLRLQMPDSMRRKLVDR